METAGKPQPGESSPGLTGAAASYVAARLELVGIEAAEAARIAVRRGILAGLAAAFATFAWALVLAGLVGLITARLVAAGHAVSWHLVAIALGLMHLLVAAIFGAILSRPGPQSFATTRVELEKDRAWLANLRTRIGSRH